MVEKARIVAALGDDALLQPTRLAQALTANDQIKYFFALLQTARSNALTPQHPPPDLHTERVAAQISDSDLDAVVSGTVACDGGKFAVPDASTILRRITEGICCMVAPLSEADQAQFKKRLELLLPGTPEDNIVDGALIDAMTSGDRGKGDSLHLVVMDAHKALNALQRTLATETIDGAETYSLTDQGRERTRAFMAGLNRTEGLRFGHPGLGTTATCAPDGTLLIQNDIGTTDAHVLVIRVVDQRVSVTYSDIHAVRLRFFRGMFARHAVDWSETQRRKDASFESDRYLLLVGTFAAQDDASLEEFLAFLGSRLVFLIDWNKARKRLRRYIGKEQAVELLGWAADQDYGHRALLAVGGEQALDEAVEYAAGSRLHYGDRLDKLLGGARTTEFLRYALRTACEGLRAGRSTRLIRDELKVELARYFERAHIALLRRADRLATFSFEIAISLDALVAQGIGPERLNAALQLAQRAAEWERQADCELNLGRADIARLNLPQGFRPFFDFADDVADLFEETASLMPLLCRRVLPSQLLQSIGEMAGLALSAAQEFIRAIRCALAFGGSGDRVDLEDFLGTLETITAIEHRADRQIREIRGLLIGDAVDHRDIFLTFEYARLLEEATDCYTHATYRLRDLMMDAEWS